MYTLQANRNAVRPERATSAELSYQILRGRPQPQLSLIESHPAPADQPVVVSLPHGELQAKSALFAGAQEDLNRLYNVLRQAHYQVLLYDEEGVLVDHRGEARRAEAEFLDKRVALDRSRGGQVLEIGRVTGPSLRDVGKAAAPIFNPDGRLIGTLRVELSDRNPGQGDALTSAMVRATARSIEERLFRERYAESWIVAVAEGGDTTAALLFAVDQDYRIVGADRPGRAMLASRASVGGPAASATLWLLFEKNFKPFESKHRGADVAASFVPHGVAESWPALVTAPEQATKPWQNSDCRLHARPRIDSIGSVPQIAPAQPARGGLSPSTLRKVREHLEENLDARFDLQGLAELAGLSRWHFARAFKQSAGMTPYNYLMFRRLTKAQDLLVNSDLPLCEITLETGFSDQSQFTRRFREFVGTSPGAYRRAKR